MALSRNGEDLASAIAVQIAREIEDQLRNRFQPEHPQNAQACLEKLESQLEIQRQRLSQSYQRFYPSSLAVAEEKLLALGGLVNYWRLLK